MKEGRPIPRLRDVLVLATLAVLTGCEPANVTAARDQLGRGGQRVFDFTIPIASDTFSLVSFLDEADTTLSASGLLAIRLAPDSVSVDVGDQLVFNNVTFDPYAFSYSRMLETTEVSAGLTVPAPPAGAPPTRAPTGTVNFSTPGGSSVVGATVATGYTVRMVFNGTDCDATMGLAITDGNGDTVGVFPGAFVAVDSTWIDSIPLDGATISQFATVDASADPGACVVTTGQVSSTITFRPLQLASVDLQNVAESFNETHAALASESRLQAVDAIVVDTGTLTTTLENRLPIPLSLDLTLNGITRGGVALDTLTVIGAAPGDGTTTTRVIDFDLAGSTIVPDSMSTQVVGSAVDSVGTTAITPVVTTNAAQVNGVSNFKALSLTGPLDPAQTPELTVAVENAAEFESGSVNFASFEDAVRGSTINDALINLTIANRADAPTLFTDLTLGAVELDANGAVPRDVNGDPVYELDSTGAPLLLTIADPGQTTFALARLETRILPLDGSQLIDRLVHMVLDGRRTGVVAAGTAAVGDGQPSLIASGDGVDVRLEVTVGLDLTLPDSGVTFTRNESFDGVRLGVDDAAQIAARVVLASMSSVVENGAPFAVDVDIAIAEGDRGNEDLFLAPDAVIITSLTVAAPIVDSSGTVVTVPIDSVTASLTGTDVQVLLGDRVTASVRVRIRPGSVTNRGAVRPDDRVRVNARARVQIQGGI